MRGMKVSDRRLATLAALGLASALCLSLLAARERYPDADDYRFLAWNLFLAWIPFVLALVVYVSDRRGRGLAILVPLAAAWLLFLPNAPYIVTDFVHLGIDTSVPIWFDAAMTASFAGTGLVLGLVSVLLVQGVLARRYGSAVGWLMLPPIFSSAARGSTSGACIGSTAGTRSRTRRRCSARLRPGLPTRCARPEAIVTLLGLMGMLAVAYLVVYAISDLRLDEPRRRERG